MKFTTLVVKCSYLTVSYFLQGMTFLFLSEQYPFVTEDKRRKKSTWRVRLGVSKVNSQLMFDCNDPVNKWQHDGHRQGHRLLLVTKSGAAFSVQRQMLSPSINGAEFRNLIKSQLNMSRQIGVSLSHSLLPSLWCSGSSVTGIREMRAALILWVASVHVSSS